MLLKYTNTMILAIDPVDDYVDSDLNKLNTFRYNVRN